MDIPRHVVAVEGVISDSQGRVLLKRHPKRGWEFPGGKVELKEDLIEALMREVREETGVEIRIRQLGAVYSNTRPFDLVLFSFLVDYVSGDLTTCDESLEIGWFEKDEILERLTFPPTRHRASDLLRHQGLLYRAYGEPLEGEQDLKILKETFL